MNFQPIGERIGTSGMPLPRQFADIAAAGYQVVINLATADSPGQQPDEAELVHTLGIEYHHIPVVWEKPQTEDLQRFLETMEACGNKRVLVHCVANYRASVFVFLYRLRSLGEAPGPAWGDLTRIWAPDEVWTHFITQNLPKAG